MKAKSTVAIWVASGASLLSALILFASGQFGGASAQPDAALSGDAQAALGDGVVTRDEYHIAVERTVACMRDRGLTVEDPTEDASGRLLFPYGAAATQEELGRLGEIAVACRTAHLDPIEALWLGRPDAVEASFDAGAAVLRCLEANGFSPAIFTASVR